jgi:hypothetical protein
MYFLRTLCFSRMNRSLKSWYHKMLYHIKYFIDYITAHEKISLGQIYNLQKNL